MCASCHVGDRQRNMNHDMIAAGHPPLFYEFTTYHHRLPKHWRDPRTKDAEHYESTLWFVGQIAALEAQVALIESRAENTSAAWPEFAHLDCAGCHQPLTANRQSGQHPAAHTGRIGSARVLRSSWQRNPIPRPLSCAQRSINWINCCKAKGPSVATSKPVLRSCEKP